MIRPLPTLGVVLLLLGPALSAQAPAPPALPADSAALQTGLRIERRLLSLDLVNYNEARERQRRARQRLDDVLGRLDKAMAGDALALGALESLQDELDGARSESRTADEKLAAELGRIQERLRRIALMSGEPGGQRQRDALSGRWRVRIFPRDLAATFDLRLDGTVVSGAYQVAGSTAGSFRGTFAGGRLHLERLDASGGFDSVWDGVVADGRIIGNWTSNELVTGAPNHGDWTAARESEP